ncbi:MAG: hypothetical protein ACRYG5_13305 [Janthinobacterium lividum]
MKNFRRLTATLAIAGAAFGILAQTPAMAAPHRSCQRVRVGHHWQQRCHVVPMHHDDHHR